MNRGELRTAVLDALNRKDLSAVANTWILSATTRISTVLRHRQMERHKVLAVQANAFPLPLDFIEAKSVRVNVDPGTGPIEPGAPRGALLYAPPDEISDLARQAVYDRLRGPQYFTTHGLQMELAPWANAGTYQIDLWYYAKLAALNADTDTNFFLTDYPHVYLNSCMAFGHRFMLEQDTAVGYEALMLQEIQAINDSEDMARVGRGALIVRPPRRRIGGRFS